MTEKEVRDRLIKVLSGQRPRICWSGKRLGGFGQIDIYGETSEYAYLIEVEMRRKDPVNNVVKVYRYIEEDNSSFLDKKVVFIHAFSAEYEYGGKETRRKNAEFVGKKMAEAHANVRYHIIHFDSIESLEMEIIKLL